MRLPAVVIAAVIAALTVPPGAAGEAAPAGVAQTHQDFSAAKRNKRGSSARASGGQQIACTQLGCHPIPRGCRIETGRIPFTWEPSGFDDVVCPYRR